MLQYALYALPALLGVLFLTLILLNRPELGIALLLVATPVMTGLLELVLGDTPIKTLLTHLFFGAIFLAYLFKKRRITGWFNPVLFGSILLGIWLAIGVTYSPESSYSVSKTQRYFMENVYLTLPAVVFYKNTWRVERFLKYVVWLGWLLCIYSGVWVLMGNLGNERLAPGSYEVIPFGRTMAFTILAAVALYYLKRQKRTYQPVLLLYLVVAFPVLIAAMTRGALLSLLVSIFALTLLFGSARYILNRMVRFAFFAGLLVVFLILVTPSLPDFARVRLIPGSDGWGSIGLRQTQLERAATLFQQSPLVGRGTGSFKVGEDEAFTYPHNIFAELLSENGLIGFALFTAVLLIGFGAGIQVLRMRPGPHVSIAEWKYQRSCAVIMLACTILYFSNAQTSFDISGNSGLWFFLAACYILRLNARKMARATAVSPKLAPMPTPTQAAVTP
jgi:O-antigen ligase